MREAVRLFSNKKTIAVEDDLAQDKAIPSVTEVKSINQSNEDQIENKRPNEVDNEELDRNKDGVEECKFEEVRHESEGS